MDRIQGSISIWQEDTTSWCCALIEDLAVKKRQEASEMLRGLSESLIQKTKES